MPKRRRGGGRKRITKTRKKEPVIPKPSYAELAIKMELKLKNLLNGLDKEIEEKLRANLAELPIDDAGIPVEGTTIVAEPIQIETLRHIDAVHEAIDPEDIDIVVIPVDVADASFENSDDGLESTFEPAEVTGTSFEPVETTVRFSESTEVIETDARSFKSIEAVETDVRPFKSIETVETDVRPFKSIEAVEIDVQSFKSIEAVEISSVVTSEFGETSNISPEPPEIIEIKKSPVPVKAVIKPVRHKRKLYKLVEPIEKPSKPNRTSDRVISRLGPNDIIFIEKSSSPPYQPVTEPISECNDDESDRDSEPDFELQNRVGPDLEAFLDVHRVSDSDSDVDLNESSESIETQALLCEIYLEHEKLTEKEAAIDAEIALLRLSTREDDEVKINEALDYYRQMRKIAVTIVMILSKLTDVPCKELYKKYNFPESFLEFQNSIQ